MTIGTAIRLLRQARGWTLKAVSMRGHGSMTMMHKIERDERTPNTVHLQQFADGLGVSLNLLQSIHYRRKPESERDRVLLMSLKTCEQAEGHLEEMLGESA